MYTYTGSSFSIFSRFKLYLEKEKTYMKIKKQSPQNSQNKRINMNAKTKQVNKYTDRVLWLCTHLELGQELSALTMCCGCVHI